MKILYKLVFAFLMLSVLLGYIGYLGFRNVAVIYDGYTAINHQTLPAIDSLNHMKNSVLDLLAETMEQMLFSTSNQTTPSLNAHELGEIKDAERQFNMSLETYGALVDKYYPNEMETLNNLSRDWGVFSGSIDTVLQIDGSASGAEHLYAEHLKFEKSKRALLRTLDDALAYEAAELEARQEEVNAAVEVSLNDILIVTWIFAFLSAAAVIIAYSISKSILEFRKATDAVGKGDLYARVDVDSKDELGELAVAFNQMIMDLRKSKLATEARGSELSQKVGELTDTKKALLNMMEDAEEINAELINAQERLKKNVRELSEADAKKNQFMSIAAHELKTPITSIHGFAQLLQNNDVAGNPAKRKKYLEIIDRETERLAKLVTDILDLSRIDLNVMKLNLESIDVAEVVESVETEMGVQIKAKGLESEYDVEQGLPNIVADRERLTQILLNLISNSVKYTPKGKITVRVFRDNGEIHFLIKDTGIGISKENQEKIFTRFYQVDSSYTRSAGGVGLGLSLCKEFVKILGGRIWFESAAGKGTTVHFTLPITKKGRNIAEPGEKK